MRVGCRLVLIGACNPTLSPFWGFRYFGDLLSFGGVLPNSKPIFFDKCIVHFELPSPADPAVRAAATVDYEPLLEIFRGGELVYSSDEPVRHFPAQFPPF